MHDHLTSIRTRINVSDVSNLLLRNIFSPIIIVGLWIPLSLLFLVLLPTSAQAFSYTIQHLSYDEASSDTNDFEYWGSSDVSFFSGSSDWAPYGYFLFPGSRAWAKTESATTLENTSAGLVVTMPTVFDNGHDIHCGYSGTTYTYVIDFVGFASFSDTSRAYKFGLRSANSAQGGTGTGANLEAKLFTGSVNGVYYTNAIVLNCEVKPTDIEDDTVVDSGLFLIPGINPSEDVVGLKFSGSADGTQLTFYYRINYGEWILLKTSTLSGVNVLGASYPGIYQKISENPCPITGVDVTVLDAPTAKVTGSGDASAIAAGSYHSLGLKKDGTFWAWGYNEVGQLGEGTTTDRYSPVQVGTGFTAIAAGLYHSLGLKRDGSLWAWGQNEYGQLGDGTTTIRYSPVQVGTGFVAISAGFQHSLGLKSDGTLWAWGGNSRGTLGDGTTTIRYSPVQVGTGFVAISAGCKHSLGLKSDGTLWAWGQNNCGQLGDGTTTNRYSPVQVGTGFAAISVGLEHSLGLKSDGALWAWGLNMDGRLGDGTTTCKFVPVQIGSGFTAVAAGQAHSLGLKSDGTLWAWGRNGLGQIGDGTITNRHSPVQVGSGFAAVATGSDSLHSLGLKSDGTLWAWGDNEDGKLGDGTTTNRLSPVQVGSGSNWGKSNLTDSDNDGLPDSWEQQHFGNLNQGADGDPDSDALTNLQEYNAGADPTDSDTDDDGMPDGWEVTYSLNPLQSDGSQDSDSDGLSNSAEYTAGTNPTKSDTDSDGMPDKWEVDNGTNPNVNDALLDADSDGLTNLQEYLNGTSPTNSDSDGDGTSDYDEIISGAGTENGWAYTEYTNTLLVDHNPSKPTYDEFGRISTYRMFCTQNDVDNNVPNCSELRREIEIGAPFSMAYSNCVFDSDSKPTSCSWQSTNYFGTYSGTAIKVDNKTVVIMPAVNLLLFH